MIIRLSCLIEIAVVAILCSMPAIAQDTDTRPIALNADVVPDGGIKEHDSFGWTVHGAFDGVIYRYGYDSAFLRVSNQKNLGWRALNLSSSWQVRCHADQPSGKRRCLVLRVAVISPVAPTFVGFEIHDRRICVSSAVQIRSVEIRVDEGEPIRLVDPNFCLDEPASAALEKTLLAGRSVEMKGYFAGSAPVFDLKHTTYGLKQALSLRDWIFEQYQAGKLKLEPTK
ncbi:hypothetical protein [Dongia sp. agr-C8]